MARLSRVGEQLSWPPALRPERHVAHEVRGPVVQREGRGDNSRAVDVERGGQLGAAHLWLELVVE